VLLAHRDVGRGMMAGFAVVLALGACADATDGLPASTTPPVVDSPSTTHPVSTTSTAAETFELPRFESGVCVSDGLRQLVDSGSHDIDCGYVIVLEDRDDPGGSTVSLPVAVARTPSPVPEPDPVIYLAGGGGHAHLDYAHYFMEWVGDAVLANRDFIQYNQRGASDTDPELSCPGYTEFLFSLASKPEVSSLWTGEHIRYLVDCDSNLTGRGVDLTQYNSATNAADARDIRIALGYEEANYYGTSYGTRLGLDLVRDFPDGVRSIVLDSVYPPEVGYYTEYARSLNRALQAVFEGCANDPACSARYPSLESDFWATVDRLNAEPQVVDSPFGPVSVDGGVFMDAMAIYLYSPEWIPRSPKAMDQVAQGHLAPVETVIVGAVTSPDINWNMFYAMQCREEIPFEDYDDALASAQDLPSQVVDHFTIGFTRFHFELCEASVSGVADTIESMPVESDVPTLVLAGRYDPATPPYWGEGAASTLTNATYVEFPTLGHGIMRSDECGLRIGLDFINDPTANLDVSCVAELPPISFDLDG